MRSKSLWTEANNERLKVLVAEGASVTRAAGVFNRKLTTVRDQARKLGTPFPTMKDVRKKFAGDPASSWRQY